MKKFTYSLIVQTTDVFEVFADTEEEARKLLNDEGDTYFVHTCAARIIPPGVDYMLERITLLSEER